MKRSVNRPKILSTAYPPEVCRYVPETETSHILGGSRHMVEPIDLEAYGYVEEEYIIKGFSNIYHWDDNERYPHIIYSHAPYCTRIIVRKPEDPEKFSGIIHCELMNPNSGFDRSNAGWAPCHEYLMSRGHGSISFTMSEVSMKNLRLFDPERYRELGFKNPIPKEQRMPASVWLDGNPIDEETENGLQYDCYSQVAALIKSGREDSPFYGYDFKKIMLQGTTGGDLSAYVAAVHPITKLPDGTPAFDGFLIFMTGAPGFLNNSRYMLDAFDYRDLYYSEVPFIHVNTVADLLGDTMHPSWSTLWHRYQPNEEGRYLRLIEIAGAGIGRKYTAPYGNCDEDVRKVRELQRQQGMSGNPGPQGKVSLSHTGPDGKPLIDGTGRTEEKPEGAPHFPAGKMLDFPAHLIICAMIDNLIKWMLTGEAPEKVDWVEMEGEYPDMTFKRDKYGAFMGGVRSPYVDCPIYVTDSSGMIIRRLSDEELKECYKSREDFENKVRASVESMIERGHLLEEHKEYLINEVIKEELPFDR